MLRILDHIEEWLIAFLIGAATLIIFLSVAHRYGASIDALYPYLAPINMAWAQELTIYMFVWMAKFGAAYGVRTGIHVGVDVLINKLATPLRNKFVLFGLASGASFTAIIGSLGAYFVWHNGMAYATLTALGLETGNYFEGPVTPDLEWSTWIIYLAIPLGSYLMSFRFLQVFVSFWKTGELPVHDHAHVEGLEDETQLSVGEALEVTEEREHMHGGRASSKGAQQ
ncbi:TRAP transporter small permease [Craterilacuibacter sp.]|uniref:TRAP transporter small permease n=1 Tax=Craterilacuibacter sp. TaxID=2870909 RepID=UPI003F3DDEBC